MTSYRPFRTRHCPHCDGAILDDRVPRDPLLPPCRAWSDGWSCDRDAVVPAALCPHCMRRFWFDDMRSGDTERPAGAFNGMQRAPQPPSARPLRQADWAAEVDELLPLTGEAATALNEGLVAARGDPEMPGYDRYEAARWLALIDSAPAGFGTLPQAASQSLVRLAHAAHRWLWVENHRDRSERWDTAHYAFEYCEPETEGSDRLTKRRMLAILVADALQSRSKRLRLQAAEYLREGGWFAASQALLEGFTADRDEMLDWAGHTRTLSVLGVHQVVPWGFSRWLL